jgi:hypothetical protein
MRGAGTSVSVDVSSDDALPLAYGDLDGPPLTSDMLNVALLWRTTSSKLGVEQCILLGVEELLPEDARGVVLLLMRGEDGGEPLPEKAIDVARGDAGGGIVGVKDLLLTRSPDNDAVPVSSTYACVLNCSAVGEL